MDGIKSSLRLPKIQLLLILGLLGVMAVVFGRQPFGLLTVSLAVALTASADYVFLLVRKIKPFFLSAALVSGTIIGLLAFPKASIYYLVTACILAVFSKNFLRRQNRHFFNPAALGLFLAGVFFHENISWWGVIYAGSFLLVPLLLPAYVSVVRMKKIWTIAGFLLIFCIFQVLLRITHSGLIEILINSVLSPQILFFCLVMLPEPMTSPNNSRMQFVYGALVALVGSLASMTRTVYVPDPLVFGLLVGNFVFYWVRLRIP